MFNQYREIMKARNLSIAIMMAMMAGTFTIDAQSQRRASVNETQNSESGRRSVESRPSVSKASRQKAVRSAPREVQQTKAKREAKPVRQPSRTFEARRSESRQLQSPQRPAGVQRNSRSGKVRRTRTETPVSISTRRNPSSNYRSAGSRVYTYDRARAGKPNKFSERRYYGGHHYHYVYPKRNARIHCHNDTYVHDYRVLYRPDYYDIFWTRSMYRDYHRWYPNYRWDYAYGHRIQIISVFDARYNLGEVAMVYGRVYATWYNEDTDDLLLFFGGDYPAQAFTVVIPGHIARRFSRRPERYFLGEHLTVTGLITTFDGTPEIVVKHRRQLDLY